MTGTTLLKRLSRLGPGEALLLAEAGILLALASIAIRLLPFKTVVGAIGSGLGRRPRARASADPNRLCWAVRASAPYLPWRIVCFQKGLALHLMLRRRGIPSRLRYGVAQRPEQGLAAHVWVSVGNEVLIGGEEAAGFTCLATFPADAAPR